MNVGKAIIEVRTLKKMTTKQLSKKSGILEIGMSNIESGLRQPTKTEVTKICKALDVPKTALVFYGLEDKDISKSKKEIFKQLSPSIKDMIDALIKDKAPKKKAKKA